MNKVTGMRVRKAESGLLIIFETPEGDMPLHFSISTARSLMRLLFMQVDPEWGGKRKGAGRKDITKE